MNHFITANRAARGAAVEHSLRVYASSADFCAIFDQDMDSLYSLSLLLTGNHGRAQAAFLKALHDCRTGSTVFPEWARSWSRRAVIKNAIGLLEPELRNLADVPAESDAMASHVHPDARAVLELGLFERFVFVISALEGYAIRECAALLGCSPREVQQGQVRALQEIGTVGRIRRDLLQSPYTDRGPIHPVAPLP
ncbi:MAG: hypothetical protein ACM3SW_06635 [Actinomycetota bacterium]